MKAVSIIVPVYKVEEEYLRQCIESLQEQTLRDIEIILVDDGSPDNCGKVCDAYAKEDARIRVIHQKNQGVSVARNVGMEAAQGKWLTFVDADDWIEKETCEKVLTVAEELNADILHFAGYLEIRGKSNIGTLPFKQKQQLQDEDRKDIIVNILAPRESWFTSGMTGCKLYRTDWLKKSGVRFPPGYVYAEDRIFALLLTLKPCVIAYLEAFLYHYRIRSTSVSGGFCPDVTKYYVKPIKKMQEILVNASVADPQIWDAFYSCAYGFCNVALLTGILHPHVLLSFKEKKVICAELLEDPIFMRARERKKRADKMTNKQKIENFLMNRHKYGIWILMKSAWRKVREIKFFQEEKGKDKKRA